MSDIPLAREMLEEALRLLRKSIRLMKRKPRRLRNSTVVPLKEASRRLSRKRSA